MIYEKITYVGKLTIFKIHPMVVVFCHIMGKNIFLGLLNQHVVIFTDIIIDILLFQLKYVKFEKAAFQKLYAIMQTPLLIYNPGYYYIPEK